MVLATKPAGVMRTGGLLPRHTSQEAGRMEEAFQVPLPIEAYVHLHPSHAGKGLARSASNHSEGSGALSMSTASRARKAGNQTPTPRSRSTLQVPTPRSRVQTPSGALGARPRASVVQGSGARRAGGGGGLPPRHASRVGGTLLTSATGTPVAAQLALSMGIPTRRNSLVNAASPLVPQMSMTLPVRRSASMSPPRGEAGDEAESAPPPAPPSAAPAPARRPIALLPLSRVPARREQDEAHALSSLSLLHDTPGWAVDAATMQLRERIGIGTFGIVYKARWSGHDVAVKKLRVDNSGGGHEQGSRRAHSFIQEMQMMASLQHAHIVRFLGGCLEQGQVSMVHELCRSSLHEVLHMPQPVHSSLVIPVSVQLKWAEEIALGLGYLHAQTPPVVHRDLKPGNVLLTDAWVAKIGDFGAARIREHIAIETARMGTCQWTAPEVLRQQPHDERADAYSFGVLLFELAARRMPYDGVPVQQVEVGVITGKQSRPDVRSALLQCDPDIPAAVVQSVTALAESCMEDDYQLRPHVEQIRAQLQGAQRALLGHAEAARAAPGWQQLETAPTELPPISEASSHAVSAPPRAVEWTSPEHEFRAMAEREIHHLLSVSAALIDTDERAREAARQLQRSTGELSTTDESTSEDDDDRGAESDDA